jgi:hypothetical protein
VAAYTVCINIACSVLTLLLYTVVTCTKRSAHTVALRTFEQWKLPSRSSRRKQLLQLLFVTAVAVTVLYWSNRRALTVCGRT